MATDPHIAALQSQITNDPRVRAILAAPDQRGHGTTPGSREAKLYELGKQLGLPDGYYLSADGTITTKAPWWVKYVGPAAVAAGGAGLAALGGAAPAIASATPAATGGMTAATAASAPAALSAQILGAGVPAAASGSIWSRLAPSLLGIGAQAVGSYFTGRAAGKAADQQEAAARDALALQKQMWERTSANQQPFIDVGTGAVNRLNSLMGGGSLGSLGGAQPQQQAPQAMPPQQVAQPPQMVKMKAPDGSVNFVPFHEVPHWEQMKAVRVF